jgi:hypothetical protein
LPGQSLSQLIGPFPRSFHSHVRSEMIAEGRIFRSICPDIVKASQYLPRNYPKGLRDFCNAITHQGSHSIEISHPACASQCLRIKPFDTRNNGGIGDDYSRLILRGWNESSMAPPVAKPYWIDINRIAIDKSAIGWTNRFQFQSSRISLEIESLWYEPRSSFTREE